MPPRAAAARAGPRARMPPPRDGLLETTRGEEEAAQAAPARRRRGGGGAAAAARAPGGAPPTSWADLPVLGRVFDLLPPAALGAAACTCAAWRAEAEGGDDARWRRAWEAAVSDHGLWRWAAAAGGYRRQLRARALVAAAGSAPGERGARAAATVFPLARRDGAVGEVLLFDGAPEPRLVTLQARRPPPAAVRLLGATLKVWSAAGLAAGRPLLVAHDVVKHLQLESGRLFVWRVRGDAAVVAAPPGAPAAARWAEHPALAPAVLDPSGDAPTLADVPLRSAYGRGAVPFEWMDMCGGRVAAAAWAPGGPPAAGGGADAAAGAAAGGAGPGAAAAGGAGPGAAAAGAGGPAGGEPAPAPRPPRVSVRVFDLASGRCVRESGCDLPPLGGPAYEPDVGVLLSRNCEADQVVAAACLFDCRVLRWRLGGAGDWPPPPRAAEDEGEAAGAGAAGGEAAEPHGGLRLVYTTPEREPIVDLSISSTSRRIFVVGMENLFVLDLGGAPLLLLSMGRWRGVRPPAAPAAPVDVGAFSWPLPSSTKAVMHLDATNSLFSAELRPWAACDGDARRPPPTVGAGGAAARLDPTGRYAPVDEHYAAPLGAAAGAPAARYHVHAHVDLRPPPRAGAANTAAGRPVRPSAAEPVVVEYSQDGGTLFTAGDAEACPAVAALLDAEREAGTYLAGLSAGGGAAGGAPRLCVAGRGGGAPRARRALIMIDTATGRRFRALPVDGVVEAAHSAGHRLALALAPVAGFPEGGAGALAIVDFSGARFGAAAPPPAARRPQGAADARAKRKGKGAAKAEEEGAAKKRR